MKGFKFKKTAYSNFILINILIVIVPNFCLSQNVNLEKDGLKFRCNVYISTYKKTGADGGEYPVIKTGAFNCQCIGGSISYGGKAYDKNSFNGELYNSIQAVQVKSLRIKGEFPNTIFGGINTIDFCFEPNEEKGNNLRSLKKGSHLDGNVNILSICSLLGVNSVIEKIKELENKYKIEEEKNKYSKQAQESVQNAADKNTETKNSDPWGNSDRSSGTQKTMSNNYSSAALPTRSIPATNATNFSANSKNATTSTQTTNKQGYNSAGQYVGLGTYDKGGSGTFIPAGPGKLRADGNYDVVDKNTGKVEIIGPSENQKIQQRTQQQSYAAAAATQQQKMQEMYRQQEQMRLNQQRASLAYEQQMRAAADQLAQSVGAMASAIGSMIADAKAKKEREKQRALIAAEKERIRQENIAMEKKFRRESREYILENFKEGNIPLFTSKISNDKLYYFVYAYDKAAIEESGMRYYVSNVVEIKRAGDGTWPYKRNIFEAMQPLTPFEEIFHGQYPSLEEAEAAKNAFDKMMENSGASRELISFLEKKKTATEKIGTPKKSLWDDDLVILKASSNGSSPAKKDPFWDIEPSAQAKQTEPKSKSKDAVDLWALEAPTPRTNTLSSDPKWMELEKAILENETAAITNWLSKLPNDPRDLQLEALKAHALYLTQQTEKALEIYKKHQGEKLKGTKTKWEEKIIADIKQINKNKKLDFTPVSALFQ
jgi:hypothetical protein